MISDIVGSKRIAVELAVWLASSLLFSLLGLPLVVMKRRNGVVRDLGDLLYPGHFEEGRDGRLYCHLRFWRKIFEALSTIRTVLELSPIGLLDEPFSTMPTLHNWGHTHF